MIVRYEPDRTLMDCEALSASSNFRPVATIRRHCQPVAVDEETGRQLYHAEQAKEILARVPSRAPHKRVNRR